MWWKIIPGIIVVLIIVLAATLATGSSLFKRQTSREVTTMLEKSQPVIARIITEEDIAKLPKPMQRYMRFSGIIGTSTVSTVHLRQTGTIKQSPEQNEMKFEAEQYFTTGSPAFHWLADMPIVPPASVRARDMYLGGTGNMLVKLPPFVTIADAWGEEIDQGSALRYLAEIVWFPSAYLSDYLTWESVDAESCRVTMDYGGIQVSGVLHINEIGKITSFSTMRYREINGEYSLDAWEPSLVEYGEFNGIMVPVKANIVWKLPGGDFTPIKMEVTAVEYDPA